MMRVILLALHVLCAGGWFGAMCYSLFFLQPRASRYFKTTAELEEFSASVSQGARWKVLAALALLAISGAGLVLTSASLSRAGWVLIWAKSALFLVALGVFCYASWRLWPRRIFAIGEEIPPIRRQFWFVGASLITIAAVSFVLGAAAHVVAR